MCNFPERHIENRDKILLHVLSILDVLLHALKFSQSNADGFPFPVEPIVYASTQLGGGGGGGGRAILINLLMLG